MIITCLSIIYIVRIEVGVPLCPNHPQSHLLILLLFGHKQWERKRGKKKKQKGKGKGTEKDILFQKRGNGNQKHPAPADLRLLSGVVVLVLVRDSAISFSFLSQTM